jgi:hypothetical protein
MLCEILSCGLFKEQNLSNQSTYKEQLIHSQLVLKHVYKKKLHGIMHGE